jgi:predicted RNA methylase
MNTDPPHDSGLIPSISLEALIAARDGADLAIDHIRETIREANARLLPFGVVLPDLSARLAGGNERDLLSPGHEEAIRYEIDRLIWVRLFQLTNVDTLMDHKTRQELHNKLNQPMTSMYSDDERMPEISRENIEATFAGVHGNREKYFNDGVEALFKGLSWKHKTNQPGKLGRKSIMYGCFYAWSSQFRENEVSLQHHNTLQDLERVLCLLAKDPAPVHNVGVRALGKFPWGEWQTVPPTSPHASPLLRLKCFKKGTTHVEILDQKYIDQLNRIMAERYPGAISDSWSSKNGEKTWNPHRDLKRKRSSITKVARQSFYTPENVAEQMVAALKISYGATVLEPSAGNGALIRAVLRKKRCTELVAVEDDPVALEALDCLARSGEGRFELRIRNRCFMSIAPEELGTFDGVVMNPPFANGQEAAHVRHAYKFVKPGGSLVAIMSAGIDFRTDGAYDGFSEFLAGNEAEVSVLPAGTFRESGTNVETRLVVISDAKKRWF